MRPGAQVIPLRPAAPPVACDSAPVLQPRAPEPTPFALMWMQQLATFIGDIPVNLRPENATDMAAATLAWIGAAPVLPPVQDRLVKTAEALLRDGFETRAYGEIMSAIFHAHVLIGVDAVAAHLPIWKTA